MRIGLAIDPETNDLFLRADGALAVVTENEAIGQHVRQRLKTFAGEWFLDTVAGMPWLTDLFAKKFDPALAEAIVKAEILNTDGVNSIVSFSVGFDRRLRDLQFRDIQVLTDDDVRIKING